MLVECANLTQQQCALELSIRVKRETQQMIAVFQKFMDLVMSFLHMWSSAFICIVSLTLD